MQVRSGEEIGAALTAGVTAGSRALVLLSSPEISGRQALIAEFALKNRLPAISPFRNFADAGGLMVYGPMFNDMRRRAATYVHKILKGAKVGDLPVEQPTKFEMVINLKMVSSDLQDATRPNEWGRLLSTHIRVSFPARFH